MNLIKELDRNLLDLAWSLWTEMGAAGVKQNHPNVLILLEELVIFTSVLAEIDPRLRDESLDWCSQFYNFICISRLKSLMKSFEEVKEPFSKYAVSLNNVSKSNWPVFNDTPLVKLKLSGKSVLRSSSAALLNIRARSIFGTGSRADIITSFLVYPNREFSIAEVSEVGYSKRNLAEVLDSLHFGKLLDKSMNGNQSRYRLNRNCPLCQMLKPIPEPAPSWCFVFKVLLSLRSCIYLTENYSESSKVVEFRNYLKKQGKLFQRIGIQVPSFRNNFSAYLEDFSRWILEWTSLLAKGKKI